MNKVILSTVFLFCTAITAGAIPKKKQSDSVLYLPAHAPRISYYAVVEFSTSVSPLDKPIFFHFWYSNGRWLRASAKKNVHIFLNPNIMMSIYWGLLSQMETNNTLYFDGSYPGLVWVTNTLGYATTSLMSDMYTLSRMYHIHGVEYNTSKYHPHVPSSTMSANLSSYTFDSFSPFMVTKTDLARMYQYAQCTYPFNGAFLYTFKQMPPKMMHFKIHLVGKARVAGRLCNVYKEKKLTWYEDVKTHIILKVSDIIFPKLPEFYEVTYVKYIHTLPQSFFQLPKGVKVWKPADYEGLKLPKGTKVVKMPASVARVGY